MIKKNTKRFLIFCLSTVAICGFNTVNSVYASKVHDSQVTSEVFKGAVQDDLNDARNKLREKFMEFGEASCFFGEVLKDLKMVVLNGAEDYVKCFNDELKASGDDGPFVSRIRMKVGTGVQAIQFFKNWRPKSERKSLCEGKSAKEIFIDEHSCLHAYKKYLLLMYDKIIEPVADTLDGLYEGIDSAEWEYQAVKDYTLRLEEEVLLKDKQKKELSLYKKINSMDFSEYDLNEDELIKDEFIIDTRSYLRKQEQEFSFEDIEDDGIVIDI